MHRLRSRTSWAPPSRTATKSSTGKSISRRQRAMRSVCGFNDLPPPPRGSGVRPSVIASRTSSATVKDTNPNGVFRTGKYHRNQTLGDRPRPTKTPPGDMRCCAISSMLETVVEVRYGASVAALGAAVPTGPEEFPVLEPARLQEPTRGRSRDRRASSLAVAPALAAVIAPRNRRTVRCPRWISTMCRRPPGSGPNRRLPIHAVLRSSWRWRRGSGFANPLAAPIGSEGWSAAPC